VIKVPATIYSTDWAIAQVVDSVDVSFASLKKTAASKWMQVLSYASYKAQARIDLGFFVVLASCNAPALPQNLLHGLGPAAVRSRQLTVVLI
jgi:hypothetical protein